MSNLAPPPFNPELDLRIERVLPVTPEQVWQAWTDLSLLKQWFVPAPWTIAEVDLDPTPGGRFSSVMVSPEGDRFPNEGCVLEAVPHRRLVFTDALQPGFRPAETSFMTAYVEIEPHPEGTKYTATALHKSVEDRQKHEEMGFDSGWNATIDQMVALLQNQ